MITKAELNEVETRAKKKLKEYPKITYRRDETGRLWVTCENGDLATLELVLIIDVVPTLVAEIRQLQQELSNLKARKSNP